ncbi:hypothetical protein PNOK_0525100 [Pyrrhoderma noxium]|uniref:THO1-MOS11 C-terminal domain-containing protein n=1 Tax=Pyrrhoderma noxium TaxID=2282107 RepID=A0A286UFU1_9AGAM|nr:hypothetical protein PNOK_0525100 [Pyrrhoderma noxium]
MESRLKALKVVDLKDILTRAGESAVKGNKPDLITKIIGSPAALQIYEDLYGSEKKSGASTPKPAPTPAPVPPASEAAVKETDKVETYELNNAETTDKPPATETVPAENLSASKETPTATTESGANPAEEKTEAKTEETVVDEEELKRRKRAERFGIPLVAPKPVSPPKNEGKKVKPGAPKPAPQNTKVPARGPQRRGPANARSRAPAQPKIQAKAALPVEDDSKRDARAKRFGIESKPNTAAGQKRGPPAENIDAEEQERRRKRAERFGLNAKA